MNLGWIDDERAQDLFRRMDREGWEYVPRPRPACSPPSRQERLEELADDAAFTALAAVGARRAARGPRRAPLVPGQRARTRPLRVGGLLLPRVRHRRRAPAVLRRPRRARRRPPQGGQRPRPAPRRHRPLLPPRLLPPGARPPGLAAGAVPPPRPPGDGAASPSRTSASPSTSPARRSTPGCGWPRSAASRCTCSTPTSRRTTTSQPPHHRPPLRRRRRGAHPPGDRCSASAACGRSTRSASAPGVPHQRGPRRVPGPRAHPRR